MQDNTEDSKKQAYVDGPGIFREDGLNPKKIVTAKDVQEEASAPDASIDIPDDHINLPHSIQILDALGFSSAPSLTLDGRKDPFMLDEDDPLRIVYENLIQTNNPAKTSLDGSSEAEAQNKLNLQRKSYYVTPSTTQRVPRIFVSHSRVDNRFCARLIQDLRIAFRDESAIWCDMQDELRCRATWWDCIADALRTRNIFIIVLSPEAMRSRWMHHELNIALSKNMRIIPLLYHDCVVHADLQNIPSISFVFPKAYDVAFHELLFRLNVSLDEKTRRIKSTFEDPGAVLVSTKLATIEATFSQGYWLDVIREVNDLIKKVPAFITADIYRIQALSLFNIEYPLLALDTLDMALALLSNKIVYLKILEDYTTILLSLSRWIDLIRIIDEALQLAPGSVYWVELQQHVYVQLGPPIDREGIPVYPEKLEHSTLLVDQNAAHERNHAVTHVDSRQRKKVFISYSHKDEKFFERLRIQLVPYERKGLVDVWDARKIKPGDQWYEEIVKALEMTKIAVLLVSADFLASDFIMKNELPPLLEAAKSGDVRILPVILSTCSFDVSVLSQFQAFNSPSNPLNTKDRHEKEKFWADVAKHIEQSVHDA
jgi:hypothetical protein